jgi:hypothetical protein
MNKYNKEELETLILVDKKSYEEIGRMYNVTGAAIKKAAERLNIQLEKRRNVGENETFGKTGFKIERKIGVCLHCGNDFVEYASKSNKYCSSKCQQEYQHKEAYKNFTEGDENLQRANYSPRPFKPDILKEQNSKCAICGLDDKWNGKVLIFVLDHIDGDASHNTRKNLRMVCPNCDSQLDTYKSKNKNGARHQYRYKK